MLAWAFGLGGLIMVEMAVYSGLMSGPGRKLSGGLRIAHPWMHRGMYALLAVTAAATLTDQFDTRLFGLDPRSFWFALIGAGMLHGIFHLWRHTALGDGAFRRMTPRSLHRFL